MGEWTSTKLNADHARNFIGSRKSTLATSQKGKDSVSCRGLALYEVCPVEREREYLIGLALCEVCPVEREREYLIGLALCEVCPVEREREYLIGLALCEVCPVGERERIPDRSCLV